MSNNVNVLEAMDSASINLFEVGRPADGRKLDKARAVVSELIDALDAHSVVCSEISHPEEWRESSLRVQAAIRQVKGGDA